MKKWIFSGIAIILFVVFLAVNTYQTAMADRNTEIVKATKIAKEQTQLTKVTGANVYHGKESCVVVEGTKKDGEEMIVWVPNGKKPIVSRLKKEGISQEKALAILEADRQPTEIIKTILGMEKGVPLWEITYVDSNGLYSFYYIDFETGELIKRYALPK